MEAPQNGKLASGEVVIEQNWIEGVGAAWPLTYDILVSSGCSARVGEAGREDCAHR
jgi:hypothetical protein